MKRTKPLYAYSNVSHYRFIGLPVATQCRPCPDDPTIFFGRHGDVAFQFLRYGSKTYPLQTAVDPTPLLHKRTEPNAVTITPTSKMDKPTAAE